MTDESSSPFLRLQQSNVINISAASLLLICIVNAKCSLLRYVQKFWPDKLLIGSPFWAIHQPDSSHVNERPNFRRYHPPTPLTTTPPPHPTNPKTKQQPKAHNPNTPTPNPTNHTLISNKTPSHPPHPHQTTNQPLVCALISPQKHNRQKKRHTTRKKSRKN